MNTYKTQFNPISLPGVEPYSAERIARELTNIQSSIKSLNDKIDDIKKLKTIHQALRTGILSASSANTMEPFAFGDPGMVLEQFTLINADLARSGGKLTSLVLAGNGSLSGSTPSTVSNAKILFQLGGSDFVRFSGTGTVIGTTPQNFFVELNLMPFREEFQNGNFFLGVGLWISSGSGLVTLGGSSQSNPNVYAEIAYQVELP